VNYRHVIDWLVRKPGAFADYRYQADLFPAACSAWRMTTSRSLTPVAPPSST